ncbi:MAG: HD domain-containing protein [Nocardioidaceae bacterium]
MTEVAQLVDGVTKLDKVKYGDSAQAETIRKMIVAMSRDIRVLVIKLADRLHNMRTLRYLRQEKQERIARETIEIFAPLAHRLGMNTIKWELEDLSFATLHPKVYDEIVRLVADRAPSREEFLETVVEQVQADLRAAKIKAKVTGQAEALLLDLPEDDRARPRVRRHLRPRRHPCPGGVLARRATESSASCTPAGTRCPGGSRTTSRCRSSTCTSRCTPR